MRFTKLHGALVAALLMAVATLGRADVLVRVTRNPPLNPSGIAVLQRTAARGLWGVCLQAHATFLDERGNAIAPETLALDRFERDFEGNRDRLRILAQDTAFYVEIDEKLFDRMFSWVENKGTGLYTAPDFIDDESLADAGMVRIESGLHAVAAEFADLPEVVELWRFIDFVPKLRAHYLYPAEGIAARHNVGVTRNDEGAWLAWIVSDLDAEFQVQASHDDPDANETLFVYGRWEAVEPEACYIDAVLRFPSGSGKAIHDETKRMNPGLELDLMESAQVAGAIRFARNVAMLRTIHDSNPQEWARFRDSHFKSVITR